VLATLNELTIAIGPNQTWFFDYTLIVTSVSNVQFQVGTPAGIVSIAYGGTGRPTPANDATAIANNVTAPIYMGGIAAGTGMLQRISGTVVTGASGGNLTMQFAQKAAANALSRTVRPALLLGIPHTHTAVVRARATPMRRIAETPIAAASRGPAMMLRARRPMMAGGSMVTSRAMRIASLRNGGRRDLGRALETRKTESNGEVK
jgi:hypothetical protein